MKAERRLYGPAPSAIAATVAACLLSMFLLLGIGTPAASAAPQAGPGWGYKASFGGGGIFETPRTPVAVDGSGNIFATDQSSVVKIYAPGADGGTLLTEVSASVPRNLAVDPGDGTLYLDENFFGSGMVRRYVSDGAATPTYSLDPAFEIPRGEGIAVDPTTGDLLVADPGVEGVRRYDPSATLLETIPTPSVNPAWITAAPDGSFYVAPADGPDITHFNGAGTQLGTIPAVGSLHGLAYDAARSLIVVAVGDQLQNYSPAGVLLAKSPAQGGDGLGLAVSTSGYLYEQAGVSLNFYVPGTAPGVEAPLVSALAANSVHVSAEVDPGAGPPEDSVAHFEYSVDGGQTWPFQTPDVSVKRTSFEAPDTVEADLTGLKGSTDYLVRLVAKNSAVTNPSVATPFQTPLGPPEVETGPANSVTETKAQLNGTIDTLGDQTTYRFEYGPTTSYGSKVPVGAEAIAGNERGSRAFARGISDLQPGTTYHYRIVAKNSAGEAAGEDRTFTTSATGAVRRYEQVSPTDKQGATVRPDMGFQVSSDGSAFAYQVGQAPADAPTSLMFSRVLSRRSPTGWLDWNLLDPPQRTPSLSVITTATHAISSDFTHSMVVSDRALTPVGPNGPYEGGGNIYIQNIETGGYTFVGGAPGASAYLDLTSIGNDNVYMGGSSDFSWMMLNAKPPLLSGVTGRALYRWTREGGLELESRLPDDSIPTGNVKAPSNYERDTYQQVSKDGSVVYFSLMGGIAGEGGEGGVYRRTDGQTTAISVSQIPGDPGTVAGGELDGASSDGRYAFFRSTTRLTSDTPSKEQRAYLYRYDGQTGDLEFVGVASSYGANIVWGIGDGGQVVYFETDTEVTEVWSHGVSNVFTPTRLALSSNADGGVRLFASPDGRYLAYYEADRSIHLYDAEAETEACVSCAVGDGTGELGAGVRTVSNRHPEVVNNEGEMYFNSVNPLLTEDHNATSDVYKYHDGRLTLISPGDGPYDARFADATANGSDVFFTTGEALVAGDVNQSVDVYDARIGGGFPETGAAAPECEGEACRPPIGRPPDLEMPTGGESSAARFALSNLRPVTAADRRKLAKGGRAHLRLTVSRAGTVTVAGKKVDGSSVKAKRAGSVSVPFSLTGAALATLEDKGKLQIKLSVHFGNAPPKALRFILHGVTAKKGDRS